jgi:predicted Zn-dependent peptidase
MWKTFTTRMEAERNKGPKADQSKIGYLGMQLKQAINVAQSYVESNEYTRIIEQNGGAGLNADTSFDYTEYFYSLPSNRIELWFLLESQRFLRPVYREFYQERDVVQEENRMRNQPGSQGQLLRDFVATAFAAFPYRNPPGGWPSDVDNLRRGMAQAFFDKYYVPANINLAIVGDVDPAQARRLAERYFGPCRRVPCRRSFTPSSRPRTAPKRSSWSRRASRCSSPASSGPARTMRTIRCTR